MGPELQSQTRQAIRRSVSVKFGGLVFQVTWCVVLAFVRHRARDRLAHETTVAGAKRRLGVRGCSPALSAAVTREVRCKRVSREARSGCRIVPVTSAEILDATSASTTCAIKRPSTRVTTPVGIMSGPGSRRRDKSAGHEGRRMKASGMISLAACAAFVSCASRRPPSPATQAGAPPAAMSLVGTEWHLEDLGGVGVLEHVQATLTFPEAGKAAATAHAIVFLDLSRSAVTPSISDHSLPRAWLAGRGFEPRGKIPEGS